MNWSESNEMVALGLFLMLASTHMISEDEYTLKFMFLFENCSDFILFFYERKFPSFGYLLKLVFI